METKRYKKIKNPWKAEAWQLRDWLCQEAEKKYGRLTTKDYLREISKTANQIEKRGKKAEALNLTGRNRVI